MGTQSVMKLPALEAFLQSEFGGRFDVKTTSVSVATALTQVVKHNMERMGLVFVNVGSNDVHITPSREASGSVGILLGSSGGFLSLTARNDLVLVGFDWFGVASTASSDVYIIEILRYT